MRDGCGWIGGRRRSSAACGGWLTRRPPGRLGGDDLRELLLGLLGTLLDIVTGLENLLASDIRVLDQTVGTGSVSRGETIIDELPLFLFTFPSTSVRNAFQFCPCSEKGI